MIEVIAFRVGQGLYVLELHAVREITELERIHAVPKASENILGVADLRGEIVPVFNLRRYLGLPTQAEANKELIDLLDARENDHRRWIAELEASVRENRAFALTTDPHQCAFGKWYDKFTTYNRTLRRSLVKFDTPHKRIHALAQLVQKLTDEGKRDSALALIEEEKEKTLTVLLRYFEETRQLLRETQDRLGIVVKGPERNFVIPVDHVEQTCRVEDNQQRDGFIVFNEKTVAVRLSVAAFASEFTDFTSQAA